MNEVKAKSNFIHNILQLALGVLWLDGLLTTDSINITIASRTANASLLSLQLWVDWSAAEELIHSLKRKTLGFWNEEPNEDEHGEGEGTKDEVCSISSLSDVH